MSTLDPVQAAALEFARNKPGVGMFIEMGLGKSLIALTEFSFLFYTSKADRMIVVCPNSFKRGWLDEVEKHGFNLAVHIFESSRKDEAAAFINMRHSQPPVLVINYEAVRMPNVLKALGMWAQRGSAYLAIDESIAIKGHRSAQTKAVHALSRWNPYTGEPEVCRYVRLLTGKPQTQGPHDLWGQLRAIGLFPNRNFYAFRGAFCEMGGWQMKEVLRAKNIDALAEIMAPVVFQAKKRDWLPALPRKDFVIRDYEMSDEQLKQYRQMETQFLLETSTGMITVEVAIAKYAKLAQIQCGFIYDDEKVARQLVEPEANPRLRLLLEILEGAEGKICVVYRHRAMLTFLIRALVRWNPAWIKGGMKPDEISEQKQRFNEDASCRLILLQCDASKFGHSLLGGPGSDDKCRTMIFFENSYSLDTRSQIEDRIHRRGQTGEYVLYIDLCGSRIDRAITRALQRKASLYKTIFSKMHDMRPT